MAVVLAVNWIAKPGNEGEVRGILETLGAGDLQIKIQIDFICQFRDVVAKFRARCQRRSHVTVNKELRRDVMDAIWRELEAS